MNLHEECLLKYLQNTSAPAISTEILQKVNELITKKGNISNILAKAYKMGYITNRY